MQLVADGTERIGYAPIDTLLAEPDDRARDVLWLSGDGAVATIAAGHFALVWPEDAHMPGITAGAPSSVLKVVLKIEA